MKKSMPILLALAICLSACAPTESQPAGETPATAETSPAQATAESALSAVGNLTMYGGSRSGEGCYYYDGVWDDPASGEAKWALFRLDYATGQRQLLQTFGRYDGGMSPSDPFVSGGRVYCTAGREIYCLSPDGSEKQVVSAQETLNWN